MRAPRLPAPRLLRVVGLVARGDIVERQPSLGNRRGGLLRLFPCAVQDSLADFEPDPHGLGGCLGTWHAKSVSGLVELKAIDQISKREEAQVINYLRATGLRVAVIINFGDPGRLDWTRVVL